MEELAKHLGKARSSLSNSLRLLKLDKEVQEMIRKGLISFALAKELLSIKDFSKQRELAKKAQKEKWTVRDFLKFSTSKKSPSKKPWLQAWESQLEKLFLRRVKLDFKKGKGKISLYFTSKEDLERLVDGLCQKKKS